MRITLIKLNEHTHDVKMQFLFFQILIFLQIFKKKKTRLLLLPNTDHLQQFEDYLFLGERISYTKTIGTSTFANPFRICLLENRTTQIESTIAVLSFTETL
jgi:hypothetical protein